MLSSKLRSPDHPLGIVMSSSHLAVALSNYLPGHATSQTQGRISSVRSSQPTILARLEQLAAEGFEVTNDSQVSWASHNSHHPRNWCLRRKIYDTGIMCFLELFTTMISNTGSISALKAHQTLGISKEQAVVAFTTTYLLAQAVGSVALSPYTESYGRRSAYIASAMVFALTTAFVGSWDGLAPILVGRFMSGLASAVPTTVLSGSIEDMWDIKARIWAIDLWVLHGIIGVALAPTYASAIASSLGWRWIYHISSIIAACLAAAIWFIKESRPSRILKKHLDQNYSDLGLTPKDVDIMPSLSAFVKNGLKKPLVLLYTEPLLPVVTIMSASVYGFAYLLTEQLPGIYTGFGYTELESATVYVALCAGAVLALSMRLLDVRRAKKKSLQGQPLTPEDKLLGFYIAAPLQAIAFWIFAWSIPPRAEHASSAISVAAIIPMGFAINEFDHVLLGYIVDSYPAVASSACAPLGAFRAILSAILPVAGMKMFENLNNNLAVSIIAIIATVYCGFAVLFHFRGKALQRSGANGTQNLVKGRLQWDSYLQLP